MPAMAWFGFPVISDNGEVFAFLDRTPGARRVMYRNGPETQPVELPLAGGIMNDMDIREFGGVPTLLVASTTEALGHIIFTLDDTPGDPLGGGIQTGPGLLFNGEIGRASCRERV